MKFALDYDKTYTAHPAFFDALLLLIRNFGHEVVILTMRTPEEAVPPINVPVFYTSRRAKKDWAAENAMQIDIWIDDSPQFILYDAFNPDA